MEDLLNILFGESWTGLVMRVLSIASLLLLARLITFDIRACYRLMQSMNATSPRGRWYRILPSLIRLALADGTLFKRDGRTLVRRTRILVEYEMFKPQPQYQWPLPDDHDDYGKVGMGALDGWKGRSKARDIYEDRLALWRQRVRTVVSSNGNWAIRLKSPAEVNDAFTRINLYFDTLKSLGIDDVEGDRFIMPIRIASGFVAPLHLLSGLLIRYNEKWEHLLEAFDHDANDGTGLDIDGRNLRQIQMFIYNCWLLWGPSIPICECSQWQADFQLVQYGFGDENNSIEVVGTAAEIGDSLTALAHAQRKQDRAERRDGENDPPLEPLQVMAVPATVLGQLRLSGSLSGGDNGTSDVLPPAARTSWGGSQDERPVLFISEIFHSNAIAEASEERVARRGHITLDKRAFPSRYYSAYLWVAFVLLGQDDTGDWKPVGKLAGGKDEPWKDFIPFFEHGNLADPESCLFAKQQLAAKALAGLASFVAKWPADSPAPLRFAFACAIDESGCGHDLAFPQWGGGTPMRALIREALERMAKGDPNIARLRDETLLRFDFFNGEPGGHPYSACQFPDHVSQHYEAMDALEEARAASER